MNHSKFNVALPTARDIAWGGAAATFVLEAITCVMRFGLRLESTRDTASTIGRFTFGIRVHHGYIGIVVALLAWSLWNRQPKAARWLMMLGIGLFCSDMIHHFLVLWPITGSPCFDLVYPA